MKFSNRNFIRNSVDKKEFLRMNSNEWKRSFSPYIIYILSNKRLYSLVLLLFCFYTLSTTLVFAKENLFTLSNETRALERQRSSVATENSISSGRSIILLNEKLLKMQAGDELVLTSLSNHTYTVIFDQLKKSPHSSTWIGHLKIGDNMLYGVLITFGDNYIIGSINTPNGKMQLRTENEKIVLIDNKLSGIKEGSLQNDVVNRPTTPQNRRYEARNSQTRAPRASYSANGTPIVDLLVLYDGELLDYGFNATLDHLIEVGNQIYTKSQVNLQIRVASTQQFDFPITWTNQKVLRTIENDNAIKDLRNRVGADLVVMLRPFYSEYHSNCGIAPALNNSYREDSIPSFINDFGFSVVGITINNNGVHCSKDTLVHEIGHNMGLLHDVKTIQNNSTGAGNFIAFYPFGYGYDIPNVFGTVMSYSKNPVAAFSNPNILCPENLPCGTQQENSVKALNSVAKIFSAFNDSQTETPPLISTNSASIFDGAGSIISRENDCDFGCNNDIAMMQPHQEKNSTVAFQWRATSAGCHTLAVGISNYDTNDSLSLPVTISAKTWSAASIQKSYQTILSKTAFFALKSLGTWTTFSVTSNSPLRKSIQIEAVCADGFTGVAAQEISPNHVLVDNELQWMGTGSIISSAKLGDSQGYGMTLDISIGSDTTKALTSFQWHATSNCSSLRIGEKHNENINVFGKSWNGTSFKKVCNSLPCDLNNIESGYYVLKIESNAGTFPAQNNYPGGVIGAYCR